MSEQKKDMTPGRVEGGGADRPQDTGRQGDVSRETSEEGGHSAAPSAEHAEKGAVKRTTPVFVYLAILFAAAFLMLLLAFFVQQRNSEITIDDLRTTMTATREDLMEQNQQLQEEKDALEAQVEELTGQAARLQEEKDGLSAELEAARSGDDPVTGEWKNRADVLTCFAIMEQAIREENYEAAAEKVRALCQGGAFELDLGIVNLDGAERFEPRERLAEVIELLVEQEALEEGEVEVP